jgi:hypothetical protein
LLLHQAWDTVIAIMDNPTKNNSHPEPSWLMGLATAAITAAGLLLVATVAGFVLWVIFR